MRKLWIGATIVGLLGATVIGVKRLLGKGQSMSGIDASGQAGFDAPEQRWSPAQSVPERSPEELQREARLAEMKEEVLTRWPQISPEDFDATGDDPDVLSARIAERSGESPETVETALSAIMAGASDKASFPVT